MNRVLPREVAQAVKVPTTLDSTEWGLECRQGASSGWTRECVSFVGGPAQSTAGNISRMHMSGDTLGSTIVVRGALHSTPSFLRFERGIRLRRGWFRVVRGTRSTKRVPCDLASVDDQEKIIKWHETRLNIGIVGYTPTSQRVTCDLSLDNPEKRVRWHRTRISVRIVGYTPTYHSVDYWCEDFIRVCADGSSWLVRGA